MNNKGYTAAIRERVHDLDVLKPFSRSDFDDLAPADTVRVVLNNLAEDAEIKRLARGLFYIPKISSLTGEELTPSLDDIASAIARNYNWTITPSGNTALNKLGLSTQVPMKAVYISDGPYKTFEIGNRSITFKRRTSKEVRDISEISSLVIQAIKAIGKDRVTASDIEAIRIALSSEQRKNLLKESKGTTSWIFEAIKSIAKEGLDD